MMTSAGQIETLDKDDATEVRPMSMKRPGSGIDSTRVISVGKFPALSWFHPRILIRHWAAVLLAWYECREQRCRLAELEDRLLQDIGKTRKDAQEEAGKPFWKP